MLSEFGISSSYNDSVQYLLNSIKSDPLMWTDCTLNDFFDWKWFKFNLKDVAKEILLLEANSKLSHYSFLVQWP